MAQTLQLHYDPTHHTLGLSLGPKELQSATSRTLPLRPGCNQAFARQALAATGWIEDNGDELLLQREMTAEALRNVLEKMLEYFHSAEEPTAELKQVKAAIDAFVAAEHGYAPNDWPWLAYAWLDVMVRESLANDAYDVMSIWNNRVIELNAQRHCERFVREWVERAAQRTEFASPRMAGSQRQKPQRQSEAG